MFYLLGLSLLTLTRAEYVLDGLDDTSFLQIAVANVTSEELVGPSLHFSVYLLAFMLVPVFALAFLCPKWVLAALIICADSVCTELPMAIFPLITPDPLMLGALVAMKPLGQAVVTPLVMRFARQRELHTMKLGLLLQSAGLLLQAFTPSLGAWFGARAAQGVASALVVGATMATGSDAIEDAKASSFVDQKVLVYSMYLGAICGAPLGGVAFALDSFLPFLFLALTELVLLAAVNVKMDTPSRPMAGFPSRPVATLRYPMVSRPVALICLMVMYISALQATIFKVVEEDFGLSVEVASFIWLFQAWPAILTALLLGPFAQQVGFRLIMLTGMLVAGTGAMLVNQKSLTLLIFQLVVAGFAIGAENATVPRLLEDVSTRYFDDGIGVYVMLNLGQQVGYVLGPVLGALLLHLGGLQAMCHAFGVLLMAYALAHTVD